MRKDGADEKKVRDSKDDDPGNPTVNFHGEKRCNQTHQSTTDPDSIIYRKAKGKEARLCFGGHVLMENRHGLCADFTLHNPIAQREPVMALRQIDEHVQVYEGVRPKGRIVERVVSAVPRTVIVVQFTTLFSVHFNLWRSLKHRFTTLFSDAGKPHLKNQQLMSIPVHNFIFTPQKL